MDPTKSHQAYEMFLNIRGQTISRMTPSQGIDSMLEFFQSERAVGCEAPMHDMLLYSWGTNDWGKGTHFELNITRQVILSPKGEDEDIWQLHLTFRFPPTPDLELLGMGERWCNSLSDIPSFREFVNSSPALRAVANRSDSKKEVYFECAG